MLFAKESTYAVESNRGLRNKSADVLWHELDRWRFTGTRGRIDRVRRAWWKAQWRAMNAPMPSQSTFRWTLLRERGPEVVLVNTAEDEDTIFEFLAAVAPELASLADRDGLVTEEWQPRGLPASYLVDPGGRLRFQALGGLPWDEAPYIDFLKRISIRDE